MQKLRYLPPEKQPRAISTLPLGEKSPEPPIIDNRHWHSVSHVRAAVAQNRLSKHFVERAFYEARQYEIAKAAFEKKVVRRKKKELEQ
jgi:hypothetical protein